MKYSRLYYHLFGNLSLNNYSQHSDVLFQQLATRKVIKS